jgi:hypothetical protein
MTQEKKKIVLTFGVLSGLLSAAMMWATLPFIDTIGFDKGAIVGYTAIVISFLFVFFGVRAYRQSLDGAPLTFGTAFGVGILITLISCVFYVASWMVMSNTVMPDFVERYSTYVMDQLRTSGATQAAIDAMAGELAQFKAMYANPLWVMAFTFLEPFPVGLLITLVSAVTLKTKKGHEEPGTRNEELRIGTR